MDKHCDPLEELVGTSARMRAVHRLVRRVAASRATVLLTGESGTGKTRIAAALHALSPRADGPFVSVSCAALPATLLEAELFGHERGAFTGAEKRRVGRFEQASGGTLFLDEIGEVPPALQPKLLRVLEDRAFERVGGSETVVTDIRLVAATNRDLTGDVQLGRFRADLYYRLDVVHVEVLPLRVRGDDVLRIAERVLLRSAAQHHKRIDDLTDAARAKLLAHRWPGNVRELENVIERAVVTTERSVIDAHDLPIEETEAPPAFRIPGATLADVERHAILTTLAACGGSTSRAAEVLEISARTIQHRLRAWGRARPRGAPRVVLSPSDVPSLRRDL